VDLLPVWYDVDDLSSLTRLSEEIRDDPSRPAEQTAAFLRRDEIRELFDLRI